MLEKIDHIVVFVTDMDKALEFYTKILELPLKFQSDQWSEVGGQENGVYIGLHKTTKDKVVMDLNKDIPDITFSVKNITFIQSELQKKGVKFRKKAEQISSGYWLASFYDLDNNKLSIFEYNKS